MKKKYFGTDGIRGLVGESPITPDFVLRLGYAAGKVFARQNTSEGRTTVLIGKDTRISGYMLEAALEAGFASAGVDILLTGPIPTPAVAYLTRALRLSAGVVISASHNPFHDNGIKFFSASGNKLPDETEFEIEAEIEKPMSCVGSEHLGKAKRLNDASGRYIEFCKSTFPNDLDLKGMKIVVDCAHGAGYQIAPHVFHELGAEVISIGNVPNGLNINDGVGATDTDLLARTVRANHADLGVALDGDADRLIMIDSNGTEFNGDQLMFLMAKDVSMFGKLKGVAGTQMTNMAIEVAFEKLGIPFGRAKVGDRYVLEMLQKNGWNIGGESSGHLLNLDKHTTGDGIVSALQILCALRRANKTLAEACSDVKLFPQSLKKISVERGFDWTNFQPLTEAKSKIEDLLGKDGRVLIRPSGTEPVLRIMVEANSQELAEECAQKLLDTLK